jgi:hypothetical protein
MWVSKVGSSAWPNADFERFVYADVATEPNGMELSARCRGRASIRGKKLNDLRSFPVCGGRRLGPDAASVVVVGDREGDIYSCFARRPAGVDLIVRAAQDRAIELAPDGPLSQGRCSPARRPGLI